MRTDFENTVTALRRLHSPDASALHEAAQESMADIMRWMHWCEPDFSLNDSHGWVHFTERAWYDDAAYNFAIIDPRTHQFLGSVWLSLVNRRNQFANIGFWVRSSCTGRGVATAATKLVASFGFSELNLNRLEILVPVENKAGMRVAEKAGGRSEGVLRERLLLADRPHDAVLFSLIASDGTGKKIEG